MTAPAGTSFTFDEVREDDGCGDFGALMGFNVAGHLDDQDIELFLAVEAGEWFEDGTPRGFDVTPCWVRKVPRENGWSFQYQDHPGRGAKAVTYFEVETTWEQRCRFHPLDLAYIGMPPDTIVNGCHLVSARKFIYLCRECYDAHQRPVAASWATTLVNGPA